MQDVLNSLLKLFESYFWCDAGTDSALCAGLMQARVMALIGVVLFIALWRIGSAVKRLSAFKQSRFEERQKAFAQIVQQHLQLLGQMIDQTSEPLPLAGPLSREEWRDRSVLPANVRNELDKLKVLVVKYNASLNKPAAVVRTGPELSALPPTEAPRNSAELKKQLAKCQKLVASV